MGNRVQSLLGYALLGLIRLSQPCSGYDLRRWFSGKPMAAFSDSPGSIYPALKKLERAQLVVCALEETSQVRRRKLYRLGTKGEKALERWLAQPVRPQEVVRGMPELFLRFSFLEGFLGPKACALFLHSLADALEQHISMLKEYLVSHQSELSRSARLALQSGIMSYECHAAWTKLAMKEYPTLTKKPKRPRHADSAGPTKRNDGNPF
jgi:DNA-binding PadR family transcriptional regulator